MTDRNAALESLFVTANHHSLCTQGPALSTALTAGAYAAHGLMMFKPKPLKSLTFRVTKVRSCRNAVAANRPSIADKGRPASPCRRPQRSATCVSTFNTRPKKKVGSSTCSQFTRICWRFGSYSRSVPLRISPKVNTLKNSDCGMWYFQCLRQQNLR